MNAGTEADAGYPPFDVPKPVAENVWIVDGAPLRMMGLWLPVRMTVVRLGSGELVQVALPSGRPHPAGLLWPQLCGDGLWSLPLGPAGCQRAVGPPL